jgi:hypothetical protein
MLFGPHPAYVDSRLPQSDPIRHSQTGSNSVAERVGDHYRTGSFSGGEEE